MGLLDDFRDIPESGQWQVARARGGPSLSSVVAAGGRATTRPSSRIRAFLWVMLPTTVLVAILSPMLADGLAAGSNGSDPFAIGAGLLRAPHPAFQPAVLAAAALLLIILAIVTRGFTRVTSATAGFSMTGGIAGVVAAIPFVLVLIAFALMIALGILLVIGIGALIIGALTN